MSLKQFVFLACLLAAGRPALAHAFSSGIWEGGANFAQDGRFSDCTMTAQSEEGILLAFVVSKEFDWGLALADERWQLDVGVTKDVTLAVDAQPPFQSVAKVIDPHGILIPLRNSDPVVDALRHGRVLTIDVLGNHIAFKLTGTKTAMPSSRRASPSMSARKKCNQGSAALPAFAAKGRKPSRQRLA